LGEEGKLRKYKRSVRGIREEDKCRSKEIRKIRYGRRERL